MEEQEQIPSRPSDEEMKTMRVTPHGDAKEVIDPMESIDEYLEGLEEVGVLEQGAVLGLSKIIEGRILEMRDSVAKRLTDRALEVEDGTGPTDYSLGLRQATDLIYGKEPEDWEKTSVDE